MPYPDFTTEELASEIWKQTVGAYPNYSVSNIGRVRNDTTGRILRQHLDCWGYVRTTLVQSRKVKKNWMTHRLVVLAFIGPPPPDKPEVNHLNGIKTDNRDANLEWTSRSDNQRHAYANGLKHAKRGRNNNQPQGEASYCAKLTNAIVLTIRASTETDRVLGERYSVNRSTILKIRKRRKWKHV